MAKAKEIPNDPVDALSVADLRILVLGLLCLTEPPKVNITHSPFLLHSHGSLICHIIQVNWEKLASKAHYTVASARTTWNNARRRLVATQPEGAEDVAWTSKAGRPKASKSSSQKACIGRKHTRVTKVTKSPSRLAKSARLSARLLTKARKGKSTKKMEGSIAFGSEDSESDSDSKIPSNAELPEALDSDDSSSEEEDTDLDQDDGNSDLEKHNEDHDNKEGDKSSSMVAVEVAL